MRSDIELQRDIEAELRWRPDIDEKDIAVKVSESVVTLAGRPAGGRTGYAT